MAIKSSLIQLSHEWTELIDNTGTTSNSDVSFYVNHGSAEFVFDTDTPTISKGMRISAGARIINVPVNTKLYGRLTPGISDECYVILNKDE